jgi:hypothetical protein
LRWPPSVMSTYFCIIPADRMIAELTLIKNTDGTALVLIVSFNEYYRYDQAER